MIEQPCVIIADRPDETVRQRIHNTIKGQSTGWWHHFPDMWIAGGHTAIEWRDMIKVVAKGGSVLVLSLPEDAPERLWAFSWHENPDSSDSLGGPGAWLMYIYSGRDLDDKPITRVPIVQEEEQGGDGFSDEPPF
jgi:hypothetical protein